ncbi:helix-turn-helix domain-containing protein [Allomuricauda taeanensis]|uniref:helix-turn-helix domain-containing protein n=1 Tax=Flagellimonas taeanensis TaxID=1005926 RepID=UPI002E7C274D|nr:helix-turn-helix domain-containing protein [Allomuricauda taeanensis]MEE1961111.1 helix-turn-helix domain-containing protein [Allomuricauda taeanensis]
MYFKEYHPSPCLSKYIDSYFMVDTANIYEDITDLVVPDGTFGLLFVDSQKTIKRNMAIDTPPITLKRTSVFGQKTKPVNYYFTKGNAHYFGVKINPAGLALFLDQSLKEFKNLFVEIDLLGNGKLTEIEDRVLAANGTEEKIRIVEGFVTERLKILRYNPDYILFVNIVSFIKDHKGEIRFDFLANHFNVNYKKIERLFHRFLGVTPKIYMRIVRFNAAIHYFSKHNNNLTELGYRLGFFDQSHFIREFRSFTSLSPSEFLTKKFSNSEETCLKLISNQW